MTGTGTKAVQFLNENCKFHILEITQDPSNYIFSRVPCWDQLIYKGNEISEDVFTYTAILDESKKTLSITKWVDDSGQIVMPEKLNGSNRSLFLQNSRRWVTEYLAAAPA